MADISSIKLPNNSEYSLKDTIARKRGNEFIMGTQTEATGTWTGVTGDSALYDGKQIAYYLPFAGSGNASLQLTLSNNTTTDAIPIYRYGTTRVTTHYSANSLVRMTYVASKNGWFVDGDYDSTNTQQLRLYYSYFYPYATLYRYMICLWKLDAFKILPVNSVSPTVATTKTLTTEEFDPFGPIYYYSSSTTRTTSDLTTAGTLYQQYAIIDLRYSFNTGTTLTANKPVFIVADLKSNGMATLTSSPIAQDLPTTEDGHIYIYLGKAYDTYRIELNINHEVYEYKYGRLVNLSNRPTVDAVSPSMYGPVGNGNAAEDTAAIQKCIDENPGGTIIFGNKTYRINKTITVYGNAGGAYLLFGASTIIWEGTTSTDAVMLSVTRTSDPVVKSECRIIGGNFNGNRKAGICIQNDSFYTEISGCRIWDFTYAGILNGHLDSSGQQSLQAKIHDLHIYQDAGDWAATNTRCILCAAPDSQFSDIVTDRTKIAYELRCGGNSFVNCHSTISFKDPTALTSSTWGGYHIYLNPPNSGMTQENVFTNSYFNMGKYVVYSTIASRLCTSIYNSHYTYYSSGNLTFSNPYAVLCGGSHSDFRCDNIDIVIGEDFTVYDYFPNTPNVSVIPLPDKISINSNDRHPEGSIFSAYNLQPESTLTPIINGSNTATLNRIYYVGAILLCYGEEITVAARTSPVKLIAYNGGGRAEYDIGFEFTDNNPVPYIMMANVTTTFNDLQLYIKDTPSTVTIEGNTYNYFPIYLAKTLYTGAGGIRTFLYMDNNSPFAKCYVRNVISDVAGCYVSNTTGLSRLPYEKGIYANGELVFPYNEPLPVANGGTGSSTSSGALSNLGALPKSGGTMTGQLTTYGNLRMTVPSDFNTVDIVACKPGTTTPDGRLRYSTNSADPNRHMFFSYKDNGENYDIYKLPSNDDMTGTTNRYYNILTSKSAVTIAQGGTGATTAANALSNLGALPKSGGTMTGSLGLYNDVKIYEPSTHDRNDIVMYRPGSTTNRSLLMRQYQPTDSNNDRLMFLNFHSDNTTRDLYRLPASDRTSTTNADYDILTTKSTVTIAQGGTGATTAADAANNLGMPAGQLAAGKSATLTMKGNVAIIFAKRDQIYLIALVDYWTAGSITIASSGGSDIPTITHAASSRDITVKNNKTSGAIAVGMVATETYVSV